MANAQQQLTEAFEAELHALRRGGRAFGEQQPQLGSALQTQAADPDVDRLLAGFAYLCATTKLHHERLAPAFLLELLALLAPELAEPMPARGLMHLTTQNSANKRVFVLPQGHELQLEGARKQLIFSTEHDTALWPFTQTHSRWDIVRDDCIRWTLRLDGPIDELVADTAPTLLEWYIARPVSESFHLLLALSAHVSDLRCKIGPYTFVLPVDAVFATRLATCEPPRVERLNALSAGLRHARNFFSKPERLAYFGLDLTQVKTKLHQQHGPIDMSALDTFELKITFHGASNLPERLSSEAVHLNVVAVQNTFVRDAMPVQIDAPAMSRPFRAEGFSPEDSQVIAVEEALLSHPTSNARQTLLPAELAEKSKAGYRVHRVVNPADGWHDLFISVEASEVLAAGTVLSGKLRISQRYRADGLCDGAMASSMFAMVPLKAKLIGRVSPAQDVSISQREGASPYLWQLIGLLPGRERQATSAARINEMLRCIGHFAACGELGRTFVSRFFQVIIDVRESVRRRLFRGALVAERAVELVFDDDAQLAVGEAFVLASLIDNLLADSQGLGDLQQVSFAHGLVRYALAPRAHHQLCGRITVT